MLQGELLFFLVCLVRTWHAAQTSRAALRCSPAIRKAFERLHGLGVIHGDPAWRHILLDSWGRIKLIDFDMSQLLEAHSPGRRAELIHDEMATVDEMIYEAGL